MLPQAPFSASVLSRLGCVYRCQARLCAAVWVLPSCPMVLVLLCLQSVGVKFGACRPMDGLLEIDTTFARTSVQIVRSEHIFPAVLGQIFAEKCARGKISIDF